MNRPLWTDLRREIQHSLGRWLSLASIVALGVAFFAGIKASAPDMKYSADQYFDKYHLQDIQVFSTLGLTQSDVDALASISGVQNAQPLFSKDYLTRLNAQEMTIKLLSFTPDQALNTPRLVEGRLPQNDKECLVLAPTASGRMFGSFQIGDTITLFSGDDTAIKDDLNNDSFKIVGLAYSPNYLSYELGSSAVGSGSVKSLIFVLQSAIKTDTFTEVDLSVEGAADINTYTSSYFRQVEPVFNKVEQIGDTRLKARRDALLEQVDKEEKKAMDKIAEKQKELDASMARLSQAKAQLEKGQQELQSRQAELTDGQAQFNAAQSELNASQQQADQGQAALQAGITQIEQAKAQLPELRHKKAQLEQAIQQAQALEQAKSTISTLQNQLDSLNAQIDALSSKDPQDPSLPALISQRDALKQTLDQTIAQAAPQSADGASAVAAIETSLSQLNQALGGSVSTAQGSLQAVNDAIAQIEQSQNQLPDLQARQEALANGQAQINAGQQEIANKQQEINQGQAAIKQGEENLTSLRQEYEAGLAKARDGQKQIDEAKTKARSEFTDARKKINDMEGKWIVLDRSLHYSYRDYEACAQRMDGIASVFPVFFFLVAALVCMTTMTRMVEEQRNQLGTLKALGYARWQIAAKYLLYAGSASVLGSIVGCAVGMVVFPAIIYSAWNIVYSLEEIHFAFQPGLMITASLSVTVVVLAAALYSIASSLHEMPASLMRPKAGKAGKTILLERIPWLWQPLSFLHKITLRNLFRYKKRFFMTVIGIAGCSALLVAGFGLNDSISDIVPRQFGAIYHYNASITARTEEAKKLVEEIESKAGVDRAIDLEVLPVTIRYDQKDVDANLNIVENPQEFAPFMSFLDGKTGKELQLEEGKALLSIKAAQKLGLKAGDTLTFKTQDGQNVEIPVGGIFEQYVDHQIYITKKTFTTLHIKDKPDDNILMMTSSDDPEFENELGGQIMELDDVKALTFYTTLIDSFLNMISSIKMVVVVLVLSAAMLAFVVLYNLSNVNISERMREIATIKVLGFTEREVNAYINRESLTLSLIGALAGLGLGVVLHDLIMNLAEMDSIRFGRTILWTSYAWAVALTMLFSILISWIMKFRLRKIEMVESLKAVE